MAGRAVNVQQQYKQTEQVRASDLSVDGLLQGQQCDDCEKEEVTDRRK